MDNIYNIKSIEIDDSYIDLWEWVINLGQEKLTIFVTFLVFIISAVIYSLLTTQIFTAKTVIMTGQQQQGSVVTAASGINSILGTGVIKSPEDMHIALLQSDNLMNELIARNNLKEILKSNVMVDLRQKLKTMVRIFVDKKTGFIIIEVDDKDPEFAANLANSYVEELKNFLGKLALASAKQRISFYEKAIAKTESELTSAKTKFNGVKELSGVLSNSALTENAYMQILSKELQISAQSHFSTDQNPDIRRIKAEIDALREQLFNSEKYSNINKKMNSTNQDAVNAYREIKSLETILLSLTTQYKSSVAEAFSNEPSIQHIEPAVPPERRSYPKRTQLVTFFGILGLLFGFLLAIIKIWLNKNQDAKVKINSIRNSWLNFKY